ncbi:MAG TPA: YIP1 family protein [Longimicrobium sp.]|nr:YIP1 family protein [Longimicrobium sp.]
MSTNLLETAAPPAPPAPPARPAPLASRIIDTFFAPTRVFEQFREGPAPWLGPVLVGVAAMVLMMAIRPLFISNQQMAEIALEKMSQMGAPNLPTVDELAAGMTRQSVVGGVFLTAWMFIRVFMAAALLAMIHGLMMGGRTALRPYAAVASHAFLVSVLGDLVLTALRYASGRLDVALDATVLMGPEPGALLSAVGHVLSPFGLWLIVLLALGGATVNRRRGWAASAAILLALQLGLFVAGALLGEMVKARAAG